MISMKNVFLLFLLLFLNYVQPVLFSQTINLKIIETSDVHGAIMPYDLLNDTTTNNSLAQVYTYVESERYIPDQELILLDNGDILQGDPLVYYYNYEDTTSIHIQAAALNFMQYDAATVGNHDIEAGHSVYDKFRKEINFPWLAANAVNIETNEPYFKPYTIIERKGIKIAMLGLITPSIPDWLPEILWKGISFEDMIESAKKWVTIIKEKEKPDLIIGLFHSGVDYTYGGENANTNKNENASKLVAQQVPGFDVVFVGHDHAGWNFKTKNIDGDSVLIVGTKARAKTIAVANILMDFDSTNGLWNKKDISGEIIETKNYKPNVKFMSRFIKDLNAVENYVQKPIGEITKTISSKESLFGPSAFVDLIQRAQLGLTGADISFASPLSSNATIDSGWIRVRDIFKLYHYENFLYTMSLSGKEINDYLEYSCGNWFNQMKDENDHLLKFKNDTKVNIVYNKRSKVPGLEERYYNFSSAAGINYTVDVSKPVGERVNITTLSNRVPFFSDSTYTVAINSYRGSGGGGLITRGAHILKENLSGRVINSTEKDLRFYIMKWIESMKTINPTLIGNWKVIPEDWWQKGKAKDYELLFGKNNDSAINNKP